MVEVRVEIMGYSLHEDLQTRRHQFKLRTPWKRGVSHDFKNSNVILSVTQEEFDNHRILHSGDRTDMLLFLELWNFEEDLNRRLLEDNSVLKNCATGNMAGLVRCNLNDQLKDQNLSPSIQWLDIYDPIRNSDRGKILIRVFTTFGKFRNRHMADDAKPTSMKSKLSPPQRGAPIVQKGSSNLPQSKPKPKIPESICSIPSQPADTIVNNTTRQLTSDKNSVFCTSGPGIGRGNSTTVGSSRSRSGNTSSGSSARSRRIAADIYHD